MLSLVLSAYNEAENLRVLLPEIRKVVVTHSIPLTEIIVVDAMAGTMGTEAVCREAGARYVRRAGGNAYVQALKTGAGLAAGDFILIMDADGSHDPALIPGLWEQATAGADVVVASRYINGGSSQNPVRLRWLSLVLNEVLTRISGHVCRDMTNSFRVYRAAILKSVLSNTALLCGENFEILPELLLVLKHRHPTLRVVEVPAHFNTRISGDSKRHYASLFRGYLRLFLRRFRCHRHP